MRSARFHKREAQDPGCQRILLKEYPEGADLPSEPLKHSEPQRPHERLGRNAHVHDGNAPGQRKIPFAKNGRFPCGSRDGNWPPDATAGKKEPPAKKETRHTVPQISPLRAVCGLKSYFRRRSTWQRKYSPVSFLSRERENLKGCERAFKIFAGRRKK